MADTKRTGDPDLAKRIIAAIDNYSGKSSRQVACELDVSPQSVNRWRKHGYMSKARMPEFCRVCRVSLEWFLTGKGDPKGRNPFENMTDAEITQAMQEYLTPAEQWRLIQDLVVRVSPESGDNE